MLKVIHVVDGFDRDAVAHAGHSADVASWSAAERDGPVVEQTPAVPAAPDAVEALRKVLGVTAATEEPVLARLVRLAAGGAGRPWGDGGGWVGLHVLAGADQPTDGGLSLVRPRPNGDGSEGELTLHLPVEVDRLFLFRRALGCSWSGVQPDDGARLLARAFLVPEAAP